LVLCAGKLGACTTGGKRRAISGLVLHVTRVRISTLSTCVAPHNCV
jgi:hypothetical protein